MSKPALTESDIIRAAAELQCEVATIKAVIRKEVRGRGFLPDGQPKVLFERHKFRDFTGGRYNASHPQLSGPPGSYGAAGQHQHDRLAAAAKLDRDAALKSASWGCFQTMGENWAQCGFSSLQAFINAMYRSEQDHLAAFVQYVKNDRRKYAVRGPHYGMTMLEGLRKKVWAVFARFYNGPKYAINNYDTSLQVFYNEAPAGDKRVPGAQDVSKGGAQ
ncbi:MAG TPA: N-acetylmuramidase family protein [Luteimonas sp.]